MAHRFCIALGDTLCHHIRKALLVTHVFAVFTLHADSVEQELATVCAENDGIELLLNEFVSILLVNFLFAFADSSLSTETASGIEWSFANVALDCRKL